MVYEIGQILKHLAELFVEHKLWNWEECLAIFEKISFCYFRRFPMSSKFSPRCKYQTSSSPRLPPIFRLHQWHSPRIRLSIGVSVQNHPKWRWSVCRTWGRGWMRQLLWWFTISTRRACQSWSRSRGRRDQGELCSIQNSNLQPS